MNYSNNYSFNLPSRDGDDMVDVNLISENFEKIDGLLKTQMTLMGANRQLIVENTDEIESQSKLLNNIRTKVLSNSASIAEHQIRITELQSAVKFVKIVEVLPKNAFENTIYFIPKAEPQENNRFDKFVYLNIGTTDAPEFVWEKLGGVTDSIINELKLADEEVLANAKAYTDEEIAKFDFIKVVDALPEQGLPNKIYFVPKTESDTQDLFDEYVWINGQWEWFATKKLEVDLTNYVTTTALDNAIRARSEIEHPIGSIYLSMNGTNPKTFLGFGTWKLISQNRMLIGGGDKYIVGSTGGAENVTLSAKQVPKVEGQIGIHGGTTATNIHTTQGCFSAGITNTNKYINTGTGTTGANSIGQIRFSNGGNGEAHNNMPPYFAIYIWRRTA